MAGMNLRIGAGAAVGSGPAATGAGNPLPSTAGQAAFGSTFTQPGMPDRRAALMPNDPFGIALWTGVAAVGLLLFIRYSLPA